MKHLGKGKERGSKKEGERVPNRKSQDLFNCDANRKWLYQPNQTNYNPEYNQKVNTQELHN